MKNGTGVKWFRIEFNYGFLKGVMKIALHNNTISCTHVQGRSWTVKYFISITDYRSG